MVKNVINTFKLTYNGTLLRKGEISHSLEKFKMIKGPIIYHLKET